jgi:hypothetical protein
MRLLCRSVVYRQCCFLDCIGVKSNRIITKSAALRQKKKAVVQQSCFSTFIFGGFEKNKAAFFN